MAGNGLRREEHIVELDTEYWLREPSIGKRRTRRPEIRKCDCVNRYVDKKG